MKIGTNICLYGTYVCLRLDLVFAGKATYHISYYIRIQDLPWEARPALRPPVCPPARDPRMNETELHGGIARYGIIRGKPSTSSIIKSRNDGG